MLVSAIWILSLSNTLYKQIKKVGAILQNWAKIQIHLVPAHCFRLAEASRLPHSSCLSATACLPPLYHGVSDTLLSDFLSLSLFSATVRPPWSCFFAPFSEKWRAGGEKILYWLSAWHKDKTTFDLSLCKHSRCSGYYDTSTRLWNKTSNVLQYVFFLIQWNLEWLVPQPLKMLFCVILGIFAWLPKHYYI